MFKVFKLINKHGDILDLCNNDRYIMFNVTGLNPVQGELVQNTLSFFDGVTIGGKRLNPRTIAIHIKFKQPVGENRAKLYEFMQTGDEIELHIQKEREEVKISGIVEMLESEIFEANCNAMISIFCPDPYFYALSETKVEFVEEVGALECPFELNPTVEFSKIVNTTNAECIAGTSGGGFKLTAIFAMTGTQHGLDVLNKTTGEIMSVSRDFNTGDKLQLSTVDGKKSATVTHSNGEKENVVVYVTDFFKLRSGKNEISIERNEFASQINCTISFSKRYGGL